VALYEDRHPSATTRTHSEIRTKVFANAKDEELRPLARKFAGEIHGLANARVKRELESSLGSWDRELNDIRKDQVLWVGVYLLLVLIPSALAYIGGLVIAWVRKGFEKRND
jgi:hypothetical protein